MSLTHADRLEIHHADAEQVRPDTDAPPPAQGQTPTNRPSFTITDAAAACAVSRKTITRKLPELAGYGAAKDEDGVWRIPVEALLAVGLRPGRSLPDSTPAPARPASARPATAPTQSGPTGFPDTVTIARDRWDDLRIRLARAEAEASERALALADARLALRALTAGPTRSAPAQMRTPTADPAQPATTGPDPATPVALSMEVDPATSSAGQTTTQATADEKAPDAQSQSAPPAAPSLPGSTSDVVAARARAAQTGGHVPAGASSVKKRRWWRSAAR
ncbi:MAG: hypothetical protein WCF36_08605 [Candidatus Nanopelagicales bacterium]